MASKSRGGRPRTRTEEELKATTRLTLRVNEKLVLLVKTLLAALNRLARKSGGAAAHIPLTLELLVESLLLNWSTTQSQADRPVPALGERVAYCLNLVPDRPSPLGELITRTPQGEKVRRLVLSPLTQLVEAATEKGTHLTPEWFVGSLLLHLRMAQRSYPWFTWLPDPLDSGEPEREYSRSRLVEILHRIPEEELPAALTAICTKPGVLEGLLLHLQLSVILLQHMALAGPPADGKEWTGRWSALFRCPPSELSVTRPLGMAVQHLATEVAVKASAGDRGLRATLFDLGNEYWLDPRYSRNHPTNRKNRPSRAEFKGLYKGPRRKWTEAWVALGYCMARAGGEEEDAKIVELLHDALAQTGEKPKEMDYLRGVLRRRVLQVNPEIDKFAAAVRAAAKQGFLLEKSERPALFEEAGR